MWVLAHRNTCITDDFAQCARRARGKPQRTRVQGVGGRKRREQPQPSCRSRDAMSNASSWPRVDRKHESIRTIVGRECEPAIQAAARADWGCDPAGKRADRALPCCWVPSLVLGAVVLGPIYGRRRRQRTEAGWAAEPTAAHVAGLLASLLHLFRVILAFLLLAPFRRVRAQRRTGRSRSKNTTTECSSNGNNLHVGCEEEPVQRRSPCRGGKRRAGKGGTVLGLPRTNQPPYGTGGVRAEPTYSGTS